MSGIRNPVASIQESTVTHFMFITKNLIYPNVALCYDTLACEEIILSDK